MPSADAVGCWGGRERAVPALGAHIGEPGLRTLNPELNR